MQIAALSRPSVGMNENKRSPLKDSLNPFLSTIKGWSGITIKLLSLCDGYFAKGPPAVISAKNHGNRMWPLLLTGFSKTGNPDML